MRKTNLHWAALALLMLGNLSSCNTNNGKDDPQPDNKATEHMVNASSKTDWIYYSLSKAEVVGTGNASNEADWAARTDWDIAFQRQYIRTNSGSSNGHQGGIIATEIATLAEATALPAGAMFELDSMAAAAGMHAAAPSSKSKHWSMSMAIDPNTGRHYMPPKYEPTPVYLVRGADGSQTYKIRFTSYTKNIDGQSVSGHVDFEYDALTGATAKNGNVNASSQTDWHYYSLHNNTLVGSGNASTEAEWFGRADWDIALNRMNIRTNSGTSNSKQGGIYVCADDVKFDDLTQIPADTLFERDGIITSSGMGGTSTISRATPWSVKFSTNADGSLIMPPVYNPTNVYVVRSADGKSYYKMYFYSYQSDQGATGHLKFNMTKL